MSDEKNIPEESHEPPALSNEEEVNKNISKEENIETLQIKNMEVHNHPLHVTHKKKWGEYLLEFLMIFLAVFLGFVAENIGEHYVENKRAKEYALLLIDDLVADTIELNTAKKVWTNIVTASDSLALLLKEGNNEIPVASFIIMSIGQAGDGV